MWVTMAETGASAGMPIHRLQRVTMAAARRLAGQGSVTRVHRRDLPVSSADRQVPEDAAAFAKGQPGG